MAKGGAVLQGAETFDAEEIFFWGWESEQMDTSLPLVAPNPWPDDEAAFLKAEIMAYYTAVLGLSKVVLAGLAAGLGKPADFSRPFITHRLAGASWFTIRHQPLLIVRPDGLGQLLMLISVC